MGCRVRGARTTTERQRGLRQRTGGPDEVHNRCRGSRQRHGGGAEGKVGLIVIDAGLIISFLDRECIVVTSYSMVRLGLLKCHLLNDDHNDNLQVHWKV